MILILDNYSTWVQEHFNESKLTWGCEWYIHCIEFIKNLCRSIALWWKSRLNWTGWGFSFDPYNILQAGYLMGLWPNCRVGGRNSHRHRELTLTHSRHPMPSFWPIINGPVGVLVLTSKDPFSEEIFSNVSALFTQCLSVAHSTGVRRRPERYLWGTLWHFWCSP